jgi:(1->4)-alpha-D-glucan 1-alpha-D-glucosylmutase
LQNLKFTGLDIPYEQIIAEKKQLIADKNLAGDVENLTNLLKKIAGTYRYGRDFTLNGLRKAIVEVLLQFPVYRTYINQEGIREADKNYIQEITQKAKVKLPQLINEINFIEKILTLDYEEFLTKEEKAQWNHFAMKLQQFTGPLMAKGVEDTALYIYNRLISLNEVGGTPCLFGIPVSVFHSFNQKSQDRWPHSMNATSTHDTKRSEDVRARINVLSEIPEEWEAQVNVWSEINGKYKVKVGSQIVPDPNDEYFLYQTLVGAFPFYENEYPLFVQRIKDYIIKAVREAKVYTGWLRPDTNYEEGFLNFIDKILQPNEENEFLDKLRSFQERIAHYGILNSLSQTLLKIAAPGVPDFYQGSELWDHSLVDPDNRRSVDFEKRSAYLQDIKNRAENDILGLISDLIDNRKDGRLKLFTIARTLEARNKHKELFREGAYIPLEVVGKYRDRIVTFATHYNAKTAIAIIPRFLTDIIQSEEFPLGEEIWGDTRIEVPQALQANWKNAISDRDLEERETIMIAKALEHFPVALLIGEAASSD